MRRRHKNKLPTVIRCLEANSAGVAMQQTCIFISKWIAYILIYICISYIGNLAQLNWIALRYQILDFDFSWPLWYFACGAENDFFLQK